MIPTLVFIHLCSTLPLSVSWPNDSLLMKRTWHNFWDVATVTKKPLTSVLIALCLLLAFFPLLICLRCWNQLPFCEPLYGEARVFRKWGRFPVNSWPRTESCQQPLEWVWKASPLPAGPQMRLWPMPAPWLQPVKDAELEDSAKSRPDSWVTETVE